MAKSKNEFVENEVVFDEIELNSPEPLIVAPPDDATHEEANALNVIARAEAGGRIRVVERTDDAGVYDVFDAAGVPLIWGTSEAVVNEILDGS